MDWLLSSIYRVLFGRMDLSFVLFDAMVIFQFQIDIQLICLKNLSINRFVRMQWWLWASIEYIDKLPLDGSANHLGNSSGFIYCIIIHFVGIDENRICFVFFFFRHHSKLQPIIIFYMADVYIDRTQNAHPIFFFTRHTNNTVSNIEKMIINSVKFKNGNF